MCDVLLTVEEVGRHHHRDHHCHLESLGASYLVGLLVGVSFRVDVVYS